MLRILAMILAFILGCVGAPTAAVREDDGIQTRIAVINRCEDDIYGIEGDYGLDGEICGTQGGMYAGGGAIRRGDSLELCFQPEDFDGVEALDGLTVRLRVLDEEQQLHDALPEIRLDAQWGEDYAYALTGSVEAGYRLEPAED